MKSGGLISLCSEIEGIVRRAGVKILDVYHSDFAVTQKNDLSPLTEADLIAHKLIEYELKKLTPDLPVLSEESCLIGWNERARWMDYWLIDPLDGTREFVKRNGEFTVNVARIVHGKPMLGVVYAPYLDEMYCATAGGGAYGQSKGKRRLLRVSSQSTDKPKVISSRSHQNTKLQSFLNQLKVYELSQTGSSLKFCRIASGDADIYLRYGATSEWDTAAGQLVVQEAGGHVVDLNFHPLVYNQREHLMNPDFVAYGQWNHEWSAFL
jgi:3'(2'), 5'-bisphosphate nucleotidase